MFAKLCFATAKIGNFRMPRTRMFEGHKKFNGFFGGSQNP